MKSLYPIVIFFTITISTVRSQTINTICGGYLGDGASATAIGIHPNNQVFDAKGNLYIADPDKHIVRKLSKTGVYSTVAGNGILGYSGDGGPAIFAQLKSPYNIAIDTQGNLYIADSYDCRIRKVSVDGIITTVAGNGIRGYSGDNVQATSSELSGPTAVAVDNKGNIFIADLSNERIRKVDNNGIITTVAGNGTQGTTIYDNGDGGPATLATFGYPIGIAVDDAGELFITDVGHSNIRKVSTDGIISTVAGSKYGTAGFGGDGGLATNALFNWIGGNVTLDKAGNMYIPDSYNYRVRKVDNNGIVTTIAGNGTYGYNGEGILATNAEMINPTGIALDKEGAIYISNNFRIQKINASNIINTIAGNGTGGYNGDGIQASASQLYQPYSVSTDFSGNMYVNDNNSRVRKIDRNGVISTIAGNGTPGYSGDGGLAINAQLSFIWSVFPDKAGNIYIADFGNQRIRKIDKNGIITTIAGNGTRGFSGDGGLATNAQLNSPVSVVVDAIGNLYVADRDNNRIRKINTDGIITTIAGDGNLGFTGDDGPAILSELNTPIAITIDTGENLLITDLGNSRVRKIDKNGIITTIAGNGNINYSGDGGPAISAGLNAQYVAVDSLGNFFIADGINGRIRKVDPNGIITTIAGSGSTYGDGGSALNAQVQDPNSVNVDASGNIFLTDFVNHRIREISTGVLALNPFNFSVAKKDDNAFMTWKVIDETGIENFAVQRSTDGKLFKTIQVVNATNNKTYDYTDTNAVRLNSKTVFYRIQIDNKDGKQTYSKVESVNFETGSFTFNIFPNPAKAVVYLKGTDLKLFTISDLSGKILISQKFPDTNTSIDITRLSKGLYIIKAWNSKGVVHSEKFIVE